MRLWTIFVKSIREMLRDRLVLALSLAFSPVFVLAYYVFFPGGSTSYGVLVIDNDPGVTAAGAPVDHVAGLVASLQSITYADGRPLLQVGQAASREAAEPELKDRDAELLLVISDGFSAAIEAARSGELTRGEPARAAVTFIGDLTNPYYAVAAVLTNAALEGYIQSAAGLPRPVQVEEIPLGDSAARSEFEIYVPGLLVFATMMMIFQTAIMLTREVESGSMRRLKITRMTALDYLGGSSLSLFLVGSISVLLTFVTALALDFHSEGPVWLAILVGALSTLPVIGLGQVVAAFSRNATQAFLVANFPLGLLMFFSGAIFPIPRVILFSIGSLDIGYNDFLPAAHAVNALNKVMTLGAGLQEIAYELAALVILSLVYFAAGVWLFRRAHMRPA